MRRSVLVFTILLITSVVFAQQKNTISKPVQKKSQPNTVISKPGIPTAKGTIFFEYTNYDFKQVDEDQGRKQVYFNFKNIGKGDLHIDAIETGCGCTSADWEKVRIYKQGETGRISVSFNPLNLEGKFTRTITIRSDGDPALTFLTIEGSVFGPTRQLSLQYPHAYGSLRFSTNMFTLKNVLDDRHDSVSLLIYNPSDKKIQLKALRSPNYFKGKFNSTYIEPRGYEVISFVISPEVAKQYGPVEDQIVLVTDDATLPNKILFFKANIVENFAVKTNDFKNHPPKIVFKELVKDLGEVYYGEVVDFDFEVTNKGKSDLILRRAFGTCGCTVGKVSTEPIKKGNKGIVSIRFDAKNLTGDQVKTISVISNDPANSYTTLTIKAKLVEPGIKK